MESVDNSEKARKKKLARSRRTQHDPPMHPLEKKFLAALSSHGLFLPAGPVVAGVSGGPDSMALLHLLAARAPDLGLTLTAVYCDHGLRPEETPAEAALVREQAERLGTGFRAVVLPVRAWATEHGVSLEHAGRCLRYEAFESVARGTGSPWITVAHTADDQAEEVMLRLLRGAGRKGLSGMLAVREGRIARPLLGFPKQEIVSYLRDRGLPFLTDSSNEDRRFLRNRVRREILPFLAEHFNPNIGETLRRTAAIFQDEEALLERLTAEAGATVVRLRKGEGEEGLPVADIDSATLLLQHPALQRRVLEDAILRLGGAPSFELIESARKLAASGRDGSVHLRAGLRAEKRAGLLRLFWPVGRTGGRLRENPPERPAYSIEIQGPGSVRLPDGAILSVRLLDTPPPAAALPSWPGELMDAVRAPFPLTVRPPRPGDRFQPLGAPGSRKLADFFSDRKIPREQRHKQPVLCAADRVVALPGLRVDHRCRVTEETRRVLEVRLAPCPAPEDKDTGRNV